MHLFYSALPKIWLKCMNQILLSIDKCTELTAASLFNPRLMPKILFTARQLYCLVYFKSISLAWWRREPPRR